MGILKKEPCESCGSQDNLVTHENGSVWCYTPTCEGNKNRHRSQRNSENTTNHPELILGSFSAIPSRRISQRTCEFFNYQVGIDNGEPVQIANYNGAQKIRTKDKRFYWKGSTEKVTLFGKQKWSNNSPNIIITEGELDALSIAESQDCKWPVVSLSNGAQSARKILQAELDWLLGFKNIILCFDSDEAGKAAVQSCVDLFPPGRLKIAHLSEKDASDCLTKGKFEELVRIVFNAQEYRPDGIISVKDVDVKTLFKEKKKGFSVPYPMLNDAMRGLPPGRITTIYAKTGIGKTTIFKEVLLHLTDKYDMPVGAIFLEENYETTIEYLIAMRNNIATWKVKENPGLLSFEQQQESIKSLSNLQLYDHFGSIDPNRLLNLIEYWAVGLGVKVVILDHLSMVFSGLQSSREGERKDIDNFVTLLRSMVERTGIHLIQATQVKRRNRDKTEDGTEILTDEDARGSGAIEHVSDYIIFLNRNKRGDRPNEIDLELYKNRYTGIEGSMDTLQFNRETGRELPIFRNEGSDKLKNIGLEV